jgi:hypothetical protein
MLCLRELKQAEHQKRIAEIKECYDPAFYREFVYHFIFDVRVLQHTPLCLRTRGRPVGICSTSTPKPNLVRPVVQLYTGLSRFFL